MCQLIYPALFPEPTQSLCLSMSSRSVTLFFFAQIDKEGHVVDLSRNASKLSIIEQEFRAAEKAEQQRLKEEEEMRVCARLPSRYRLRCSNFTLLCSCSV